MTALRRYVRLETTGVWRADPGAQRRDVFVSFGDASLVVADRNGTALTHWSLAAVERLNPGARPALFAPDTEASETLEIADPTMEEAIEAVRAEIARRRPQPGRLRAGLLVGALALVLAILVVFVPRALVTQTAAVLPDATRAAISAMLMADIERLAGAACSTDRGAVALDRLAVRLLGEGGGPVAVLRDGLPRALRLPDGTTLVHRSLVEDYDTPEVLAGFVLAEAVRAERADPMLALLERAGTRATFRLLTSGELPPGALDGYAEALLTAPSDPVPTDALLARFGEAGVASSPFAYAIDVSGEATLPLIEADPAKRTPPVPVLDDADWVSLQAICGG